MKQKRIQSVELVFDGLMGEIITLQLSTKQSEELVKYLDKQEECKVLFPDYEA